MGLRAGGAISSSLFNYALSSAGAVVVVPSSVLTRETGHYLVTMSP